MSQIQNVITTTFRARGGNVVSQLGSYAQGFGTIGRQINDNVRMSERLNNQWRAFGTTIRYALAGGAIFGLTRLVGQLKDVQVQMGLISAIGETVGGRTITGTGLADLMDESRMGAVRAITPVSDYNNAVINLLSTIQGVPDDQITPIVTDISQAARLAQVNAEDATKAFTTMNVAFGQVPNLENIHRMAQEFFILTREAPGGVAAGQQVITQLGQLAQVTRAAHGTPQDMFALLLSTLRSGIPPQQAGRGLQFLIQTVAFPGQQTAGSRQALEEVGINTNSNLNLQQRLGRIFGHARRLGISGDLGKITRLDEETLADMEAQTGGAAGTLETLGISGRGAAYLGTVFRRIHALRTALAIQGQLDTGQAQADLSTMAQAAEGHVSEINDLSAAWQRFRKQARLQEASVAMNALGLQIASAFAPLFNFGASGLTALQGVAGRHPRATRDVALGAGGFLAALGIGRFLGAGNLPGIRRLPGLRGILGGSTFVRGRAIEAALSGAQGLGATPQNPLYVIVVGQLFGGNTPGPSTSNPATDAAKGAGIWALLKKVGGGAGTFAIGRAGALSMAGAGLFGAAWALAQRGEQGDIRWSPTGRPYARIGGHNVALDRRTEHFAELQRAQQLYGRGVTGIEQYRAGMLRGQAEIFLVLDQKDATGKITRRRVHVPLDLWQGGRHPSNKGAAGKTNRGH